VTCPILTYITVQVLAQRKPLNSMSTFGSVFSNVGPYLSPKQLSEESLLFTHLFYYHYLQRCSTVTIFNYQTVLLYYNLHSNFAWILQRGSISNCCTKWRI